MSDNYWAEPLKWNAEAQRANRRARVFCASMADVFESEAPAGQLERLWQLIRRTPWLDWQLLTKRPARIRQSLPPDWGDNGYSNVWLGTSVEDANVLHRVRSLVSVPAQVHFLSVEPLIGPISHLPLRDVEWVIVGGESGSTPRNMEQQWVLEIKEQCEEACVAFFFKQWGGVNKKARGRVLEGRTYSALPVVDIANETLEQQNEQEAIPRRRRVRATNVT